jgi:signal transduction histidine kinase
MIMSTELPRILVIDDEIGPRESLRILLKRDYEVLCADSVNRGLELLKEYMPETVVLDIRMPGMNGIEGLREIRRIDPNVSVIMLTGYSALETARDAIRLGANDYLRKPFEVKEMEDIIRLNVQRTRLNRKRASAEKELQDLNRRLLDEMARKDRMASLGQASQELVHDLRNPLTVVLGYVQILADDLRRSKDTLAGPLNTTFEYVDVIEKSALRCRDLIEVWQNLGRKNERNILPVAIADLLKDIVKACNAIAVKKNAVVEFATKEEDILVQGDPTQLGRTVQNLIGNAIDALPDQNGVVKVSCEREDGVIVIRVADNGCGMDNETLRKAFEPYFTTKDQKGTGLGLFITKRIIEDHKGTIEMLSTTGKGTTAIIRLPILQPAAKAQA